MLFMGGKSDDCAANLVFLLGLSVAHGCGSLPCLGGVISVGCTLLEISAVSARMVLSLRCVLDSVFSKIYPSSSVDSKWWLHVSQC